MCSTQGIALLAPYYLEDYLLTRREVDRQQAFQACNAVIQRTSLASCRLQHRHWIYGEFASHRGTQFCNGVTKPEQ